MDWVVHLEYLQAMLNKFKLIATSNKDVIIQYFQDELRLLIRTQLDKQGHNHNNYNTAIQKAIDAETKTSCQPFLGIYRVDTCCP